MLTSLRDQRLSVLDELMDRSSPPTLEEFLQSFAEGFVNPLLDKDRGRLFMALVSREMNDLRLPLDVFLHEFINPVFERAMAALAEFGPPLDPETARMCVMSMVAQLLHALRTHHLFSESDNALGIPADLGNYIPHFVRFTAGGIR